jgi:hypothetical protein
LSPTGGLGRSLVNLNSVQAKVETGVFDMSEVSTYGSIDEVVNAWADVKKKGVLFLLRCSWGSHRL